MSKRKRTGELGALAREALDYLAEDDYSTAGMLEVKKGLANVEDQTGFARAYIEAAAAQGLGTYEPPEIWKLAAALVLAVGREAASGGFVEAISEADEERLAILSLFDTALRIPVGPLGMELSPELAAQIARRLAREVGSGEHGAMALVEALMMSTSSSLAVMAEALLQAASTKETGLLFAALAALSPLPLATRERMLEHVAARGGPPGRAFLEGFSQGAIGSELYPAARRLLMRMGPATWKGRKPSLPGVPLAWKVEAAFACDKDATGSQAFYIFRRRGARRLAACGFVVSDVRGIADAMLYEDLSDLEMSSFLATIEEAGPIFREVDPGEAGARLLEGLALAEAQGIPLPLEMETHRYFFAGLPAMPAKPARGALKGGLEAVYQLKVTLDGAEPPVWRRLLVRGDTTLDMLHSLIQEAMGWEDCHLHMFKVGKLEYGPVTESLFGFTTNRDERLARLGEVLGSKKALSYEYDFGDGWEHTITVEKALTPEPGRRYPAVVDGQGACPPEDSGGVWGYAEKLRVLRNPAAPDHEEVLEWMGEDFDPERFDLKAVDAAVARVARRRKR